MNYSIILRLLSVIMLALTAAFLASLGLAYAFIGADAWEERSIFGFAGSAGIAALLALVFRIASRRGPKRLFSKEALTTIGVGWLLATVVGALPYLFIVPGMQVSDAIFESASGFTTTGASIFKDVETLPRSLVFWRSMSQWIGGLGVVVFFVAILSFLGAGAKILFSRESSAQAADLGSERVQTGVMHILQLYLALSVLCTLAYWWAGMSLYDAVNHMFTTISTGGFSTYNRSMAHFDSAALEWWCILFMTVGGASFVVMLRMIRGDFKSLRQSTEMKSYLGILLAATLATALFNIGNEGMESPHALLRHSAFQVVSIMTTTGYATRDFDTWLPVLHVLMLLLMAIGGCAGSTAGGIKVVRTVAALRATQQLIERSYRTQVVRSIRINGQVLSQGARDEVYGFLVMMALVVNTGILLVALLEPYMSFEGSISATFACLFNIGPGLAEIGPTMNFSSLHAATKYFLSLLMIMGRVELFAILVLFSPSLWKHY